MRIIYLRHRKAPALGGCRWCGIVPSQHSPGRDTWTTRYGYYHPYTMPTQEQWRARASAHMRRNQLLTVDLP